MKHRSLSQQSFYKLAQTLTRQVNRLVSPKGSASGSGNLYTRLYLNHIRAHLNEIFGSASSLLILDAGCGAGRIAIPLAQDGHTITGIDYHAASLKATREAADSAGARIELIQGDLGEITKSLESTHFDVVLCTEVLSMCSDYRELIEQFNRILKPGGLLLASFLTPFYFITTLLRQGKLGQAVKVTEEREGMLQVASMPAYYNWNTRAQVADLYDVAGLELLSIHPIGTWTGHGVDGMAAIVDLGEEYSEKDLDLLYRLETTGIDDYQGVARFLLAAGRKP